MSHDETVTVLSDALKETEIMTEGYPSKKNRRYSKQHMLSP